VKLPWKEGGLGSYFAKKQGGARSRKNVQEVSKGGKKEPSSGAYFPGKVCLAGDRSSCVDLTGVGVRKKRLIGIKDIKAYAVGVYFNPADIKRAASAGAREERAPAALDNVLVQNGKSIIRLVVVFPRATGKQISKSLDDQIGNTLRKSGHYKDFEDFSQAFYGYKFKKGTVITFSKERNGTLTTFIDGQERTRVRSKPLNQAISELYLGRETITKDLRADTLSSIDQILPHS